MKGEELSVLLIEEASGSFSGIIRRLEKTGCRCRSANSYAEARSMLAAETPELVLSAIPPREKAMSSLTAALAGTGASVFYAHLVEDSCWWLPALRNGLECFGAPAMRPGEFTSLLDRVVAEIRERRTLKGKEPERPVPARAHAATAS
ncbi:MAG TPA: hypothetical protein VNJ52_11650 [Patescibacteria group bacterium]|nr:hypothetical protein [Patescibacteria group bacterium]